MWSSSGSHCFAFLVFLILVRAEVGQVSLELNHSLNVSWLTDFQHLWLYVLSVFRTTISSYLFLYGSHLFELQLSESSLIQIPQIMIFIDILLCIKWKVLSFEYCFTYQLSERAPSGPNVFG